MKYIKAVDKNIDEVFNIVQNTVAAAIILPEYMFCPGFREKDMEALLCNAWKIPLHRSMTGCGWMPHCRQVIYMNAGGIIRLIIKSGLLKMMLFWFMR